MCGMGIGGCTGASLLALVVLLLEEEERDRSEE
jgi:lipid-binding SYLF domain-containing protein